MPLPNSFDLNSLEYPFQGEPFVQISGTGINTDGMDYPFQAEPFNAASISSIVSFDEAILITDLTTASAPVEGVGVLDDFQFLVTISFDESVLVSDVLTSEEVVPQEFNLLFSTLIQVESAINLDYGSVLSVSGSISSLFTTNINVQEDYLLPITNVTSPSNIFEPTIIVNGSYIVQNPSTDPGGDISNTSLYVNIKNAGLTGISACDLEGYSFTLDYSGGNFSIISAQQMGSLGSEIDLYGFKGTITTTGQTISNGQAGFSHRGIFGAPKLNRFFQYIMSANTTMLPLLTNPSFFLSNPNQWQSAASIARAIAAAAGIELQWLVFDTVVSNFRLEDNMTALDALSSMASRAGAQLRWNGNNKYIITYPDQFFGYWSPPSCTLISAEGLSNENYLDLTTGLYGVNPSPLPQFVNQFQAGERTLPTQPNGTKPQVQQVAKVKNKLTSEDPPLVFDLPFDYDTVYIQILVSDTGDTGGSNQVALRNFVTRDADEWFEFDIFGFNNEYVFMTNVGGAYIPQVKVDYRLFPEPNTSVDNNNFVLSLACTRRQLPLGDNNSALSEQAAAAAQAQDYYRFMKSYSGTFSCVFFGSIPIPGMWASATIPNVRLSIPNSLGGYDTKVIGDITVEGIIESVNFSFPGLLTIQVAQYKRLSYVGVARINYGPND